MIGGSGMKKNIILITTDEQHLESISYFGARSHETTNMDFLAEHGHVFTNAYSASPICLPSRCTMMTGMYPHKSGSISNHTGASLSLQFPNLFTELKKAGYSTSLHGKCHFIPVPYPATRRDMTQEYEHFAAYYRQLGMDRLDLLDGKSVALWYYNDYTKYLQGKGLVEKYRKEAHMTPEHQAVFVFPLETSDHPDAWVGQKAVERIRTSEAEKNFIWCSFPGPHAPVDPPEEYIRQVDISLDPGRRFSSDEFSTDDRFHYNGYWGPGTTEGSGHIKDGAQKGYPEEFWRKFRQYYFANIKLIDDYVGKLIEAANDRWGEDYQIIFTSDHGEMMGNHSMFGKNGAIFEDVLRVPLMIYSPAEGHAEFGERVSSVDLFPTIMEMAGIQPHLECDGVSYYEDVRNGGRRVLISECENRIALLFDNYKLEWNYYEKKNKLYKEFYDLNVDKYEFINNYNNPAYKEIINEMESYLQEKEKSEHLLSTLFYRNEGKPYYLNCGSGAGYLHNGGPDD